MQPAVPSTSAATIQVPMDRTDNVNEQAVKSTAGESQSDGLVSGA
jgi:hypothetical protein